MLTITVDADIEQAIRDLAVRSGVSPEDVGRVLLAAASRSTLTIPRAPLDMPRSPERMRELLGSFGSDTPDGVFIPANIDVRELAYQEEDR